MAVPPVRLLASAPPIFLSPYRLFLHRHLTGDGRGGSLRLQSSAKLHSPLRISLNRGPGAARSSQDAGGFLSGFNPREITSTVHTSAEDSAFVEGEMDSDHPSIWKQMKEIALFAAPATGLWICGPLMSLIDTMVVGHGSSLELAALGPGTVFCDNLSYIFMFLSISTSNMVATSLAKKDKNLAQHQISMLLFVAFASGVGMFLFTKLFGVHILTVFSGSENLQLVAAANSYIQIRGLAWPAILVGLVAQSASLGMKDSWGPLKALTVASAVNGVGDVFLCSICGYGIAGAAWATMFSQVIAASMMVAALNKTGFRAFSVSIPSPKDLLQVYEIAAPVFVTMTSKVAFYSLLTYSATSMGTITVAAHQVMINVYCLCTVWGEPLSQTAQTFMPELIHGANRSLTRARILLKSLVIIGALIGLTLGLIGTTLPWTFPNLFTVDHMVIGEMHKVLLPYFIALMITPSTHSLEGTLLAGRDLRFLSFSMTGCFCVGGLLVLLASSQCFGLPGCWWGLAVFQWEDRPLFVQFCANDPDVLLEAARKVEPYCDYVDINLGCPQRIARRGNYGAFLMDNLPLIRSLVEKLSNNLHIPVSCKVRIFPNLKDTLEYATMLEEAGCALLAVHGRTRDEKDGKKFRADWDAIKAVKNAVRIPVLANGNIRHMDDVQSCLKHTGADGVLSAESLLENPALFAGFRTVEWRDENEESFNDGGVDQADLVEEYLKLCEQYHVPWRMVRSHVHKMLGDWFRVQPQVRQELNTQSKLTFEWLYEMVNKLRNLNGRIPLYLKVAGDTSSTVNGLTACNS